MPEGQDDVPRPEMFPTSAELMKALQERSDDFESLTIMVVNDLPVAGPQGQGRRLLRNACCVIKTCGGNPIVIHRDDLQMLLNDGILQRLKIPIRLMPQEDR